MDVFSVFLSLNDSLDPESFPKDALVPLCTIFDVLLVPLRHLPLVNDVSALVAGESLILNEGLCEHVVAFAARSGKRSEQRKGLD